MERGYSAPLLKPRLCPLSFGIFPSRAPKIQFFKNIFKGLYVAFSPGRRLILDSRLRKLPFRFDDPLMKTHVLPAHNGKREKVPATVGKSD